ncbi:MAG TPA: metallophosphoesterase [Pyrinomonadaceae bacterium]|nr:metallophosphoesterase [Pyrinomonadaceae bacterium]
MKRRFTSLLLFVAVLCGSLGASFGQTASNKTKTSAHATPVVVSLPRKDGSVRFGVVGDTGTGSKQQYQLGDMMVRSYSEFPFEFVLLLGDNMYGGETPTDFVKKFAGAYKPLLDAKVKFYATLGNHDLSLQSNYVNFNMDGKEYYRFKRGNVAFYSLNSNYMDQKQIKWLETELAADTSEWKVCFFHHPPYSSAKAHGSDKQLREVVEPIFVKYGVNVVLTGHDHVYERIKPQKGIYYFVSGAGGKLRRGDVDRRSPLTDKAFDSDMHFMLFEVAGDQLYFQAISRTGETVDSGVIARPRSKK